MLSVDKNIKNEIIIEKSKFITYLCYLNDFDEIDIIMNDLKKKYKDATHHCYAYIYDEKKKMSDDGEPSGTAGMPILNVLESNKLNHILCIVIRYFGGTKLGAGGLVRAYTRSVTDALEKTNIVNLEPGLKIRITFSYNMIKQVDYILNQFQIINKEFGEYIKYEILISKSDENILKSKIKSYLINYEILEELYIKR